MCCAGRTLQALKTEAFLQPTRLSASVFGYDDILKQLHPFLRSWRSALSATPTLQPYIISTDVKKAFDSIDVQKLRDIVEPLFEHPEYLVR